MRAILGRIAIAAALISSVFVITAPAAHAGPVVCGQTIVANTVLMGNVGPCGPCGGVIIGANNVTLDLNGFTISGLAAPGDGPGILVPGRTNVTIRNGTVRNFDAGVVIQGGSGNTVTNMQILNNIGPGPCAPFTDGIAVIASSNNRIATNSVISNWIDGISISTGASGNLVFRNRVANNGFGPAGAIFGDGIRVFGRNNLIRSNFSVNNARDGISVGKRSPAGGSLLFPDGRNNLIVSNFANPNGAFDHWDSNPGCDANTWFNPIAGSAWRFGFIAPPCAI